MQLIKKISISLLSVLVCNISMNCYATDIDFGYGDYFQVERYNGHNIVWQYIDYDEDNGMLLTTKDVLCQKDYSYKRHGWIDADIREWLNSTDIMTDVLGYNYEIGFLSSSNFSNTELELIKNTNQWTMCADSSLDPPENGVKERFSLIKIPAVLHGKWYIDPEVNYTIDDIPNIYFGAASITTDKIFLLDAMQIYNMRQNTGEYTTVYNSNPCGYYMRHYGGHGVGHVKYDGDLENNGDYGIMDDKNCGIRPAFYLDETAIVTCTGTGTLEDPYVLNAPTEQDSVPTLNNLSVELNGNELTFDQPPIIQNDRVMVPFRAIFEALGADVEWIADTQTVIGTKDDTTITLTIGSDVMNINDWNRTLDSPPIIVNDRTLVPVRAISEALECEISWDEATQTVSITN